MKLTTNVQFDIFNRDRSIRLSQRQKSRSWTQGLMECLYVQSAQIRMPPGHTVHTIDGQTHYVDTQTMGVTYYKSNLRVVGGGGNGSVTIHHGGQASAYTGDSFAPLLIPSHLIGIQVGGSNTAVTPTDRQLLSRFGHGNNVAAGAGTIFDSNAIVVDTTNDVDSTYGVTYLRKGNIWTPRRDCFITSVDFRLFKSGSPGLIYAQIFGCYHDTSGSSGSAYETHLNSAYETLSPIATSAAYDGDTLGASPGAYVNFAFATPVHLHAGVSYFIGFTAPNGTVANYIKGRTAAMPATVPDYKHIAFCQKDAAATNCAASYGTIRAMKLYGTMNAEIEYGGMEISNYDVANPNASFNLRRLFYNNNGADLTIQECGIYAGVASYALDVAASPIRNDHIGVYSVMLARDVIAPAITLSNGETLLVTYTPSITV